MALELAASPVACQLSICYSLFERKAIKFAVRRAGPVREPGPLTLTLTAPPSKVARSNACISLRDWNSVHFDLEQCAPWPPNIAWSPSDPRQAWRATANARGSASEPEDKAGWRPVPCKSAGAHCDCALGKVLVARSPIGVCAIRLGTTAAKFFTDR
jgi:hypothetical protein